MIIVHVIADLTTGGAEIMMKRLIEAHGDTCDFQHHVISLHSLGRVGPELQAQGIPVQPLGMRGALEIPKVIKQLAKTFREIEPDVVHCWMYHANLLGGAAARLSGNGRVIWGIRATGFNQTMGVSRATTLLRRGSAILSHIIPAAIVYVANAARAAHEKIGYASSKGLVIPNGYPPPHTKSRASAARQLGLNEKDLVVGSVGRFNAAKDPRTFVEAAAMVSAARPEARFVMIGRGVSPNAELEGWIAAHAMTDRFVLLGDVKDVDECLVAMDIFCLHSVTEGFPNVVAEAMNSGVPCVVTDVGDAAALIGDAGTVVPPSNPRALADAIVNLIDAGSDARRALGEGGRRRIMERFSIESIVKRYEALYRALIDDVPLSGEAPKGRH